MEGYQNKKDCMNKGMIDLKYCCKDCKKRHYICWKDCEDYHRFKEELERIRQAEIKDKIHITEIKKPKKHKW